MNFKRKIAGIIIALVLASNHSIQGQNTQSVMWAIMQDGRVCYRDDIDATNPMGKTWKETDGFGQEIVVNKFGHVWKIDPTNSNIQVRTGVTLSNPAGTEWTPVDGKANHLAIYEDDILAIHAAGVYKRTGITPTNPEGTAWQQVMVDKNLRKLAGCTEVQLPVGLTETIAAIDANGTIYFQSGITEENLQGGTWVRAKENHFLNTISGKIISLAVNDYGTLWAINEAEQINYKKDLNTDWLPVKGALKQLDIDDKGNVWGISKMGVNAPGGLNYHPADADGWQPLGDGFAYVTVNKITGHALAVKIDGTIVYCSQDGTTTGIIDLPLPRRDGKPVSISMAAINKDNYVWALDTSSDIWFAALNPLKLTATTWVQISGKLKYISITNRGQVRGIDVENKVFFRTQVDPLNLHGIAWEELKTPADITFDMIFSSGIELGEVKQDPAKTKKAMESVKGLGRPAKKLDKKTQAKKAQKPKAQKAKAKKTTKKATKPAKKQQAKHKKETPKKPVKQAKNLEALNTVRTPELLNKAQEPNVSTSAQIPVIEIEKVATSDVSRELTLPQEKTHIAESDAPAKKRPDRY